MTKHTFIFKVIKAFIALFDVLEVFLKYSSATRPEFDVLEVFEKH